MPLIMACPHPKCDHPGPLGFGNPHPWGMYVYHGSSCPGVWLYDDNWYANQAEAWKQYKKDRGPFDANWTKAYDALILEKNERKYKIWINRWSKKQEDMMQRRWGR